MLLEMDLLQLVLVLLILCLKFYTTTYLIKCGVDGKKISPGNRGALRTHYP